ncbi:hypothetical protein [Mycobacteroides abscessus]|uniref:hypothetical protein n=1 Tax=Mycobacteroides abscessus TaxID=36809 RepID=UPI0009CD6E6E|nr:hypothetical protein [Mycobacteroides abscessus]SKG69899.1 Uncharacterised protein [Mycobacteroides abscessus subsp. massiliense]SKH82574.1 Uncharacterised protein [Mycobacteroides abscessus subsp. massiliense]SKI05265.1 Uncharacterised protein [Mycobacteroides abscessus subsp. massiliense]SKI51101.1 Uncharacterised protein [Mycobacteroides abscessus subsp. massiliense]SKJ72516.1 Uncharacterised protein [Mycobacteroides abscessus subsp. massiliense]
MNQDAWPFIAQMIAYFAVAHGISLGLGKVLSSSPRSTVQLAAKRVEASAYFALAFSSLSIVNTWNVETAVPTDRGLLVMEWAPTVVKAAAVYFLAVLAAFALQMYIPHWANAVAHAIDSENSKWFLRLTSSMVVLQVVFSAGTLGAAGIADYLSVGWWVGTAICSILLIVLMFIRAFFSFREICVHTTPDEITRGAREPSENQGGTSPEPTANESTQPETKPTN